jgi:hydrogenase maturation protease
VNKKILIIGIGNDFRCDDRIGLYVCDLIRDAISGNPMVKNVDIAKLSGEGTELMDKWNGYDSVIIADASQHKGNPGKITRLDVSSTGLTPDYFHYSTHSFSLAEAVELSRNLARLPRNLVIYAIEGMNFSTGRDLTMEVELAGLKTARNIIREAEMEILSGPEK